MKILYLECNMGASGDMLIGALSGLFDNKEQVEKELNSLGLPDTVIALEEDTRCGIAGIKAKVYINGREEGERHEKHHSHMKLEMISEIIDSLKVSDKVKSDAKAVYNLIAEAESTVHNTAVCAVHFHELGAMDAVADVVCCAYLFNKLGADRVYVSPVNVGSGSVRCAHGILPVPAPAAAYLLRNIPFYVSDINAELCTPTGAALIKYFATDFSLPLQLVTEKIGYGLGEKSFDTANCLRVFLSNSEKDESVVELICNVDDMTGEEISFACETFLREGALDVYTAPIYMKKSRPAFKITVMCERAQQDRFIKLMFRHTATIGIRCVEFKRFVLDREEKVFDSSLGKVRVKVSKGYSVCRKKAEYDDLKKLSQDNDLPIQQVKNIVENEF